MSNWQDSPFKIEAKENQTLAFCSCGFSDNAPYCDSSHKKEISRTSPIIINFKKNETISACGCRHSNNRPFCDGTHNTLKNKKDSLAVNDEIDQEC